MLTSVPVLSANADTIPLLQQAGVTLLGGVSCGGQHISTYVTGFNSEGNITGELYVTTTCSTGGRGTKPRRYSEWRSMVWSVQTGLAILTAPYDGIVPDPLFTDVDAAGNTISTLPSPQAWPFNLYGYLAVLDTADISAASVVAPGDGGCAGSCHR
jgi:hypothetical protein